MVRLQGRAGTYTTQSGGYSSFVPKPLPPVPPIEIDDGMLTLLSNADRNLGRLDGATETLPNPDLFVFMYVRKEAVLSSQIEGTQSSLIDFLEFEAGAQRRGLPRDVAEVSNYVDAMNFGLEQIKKGKNLSLALIRQIHSRLLRGVRGGEHRPGEFRHVQNWIGSPGSSPRNAVFIPPAVPVMQDALAHLEAFLLSKIHMPPLIKVGLAHAQFETIHPFLDGNGRMGRLLITFLLTMEDFLSRPLLYLSYYFRQNRTSYYEKLQSVRDDGDWEAWMKFFLRGVYEVSDQATKTARKIVRLREEHRGSVQKTLGSSAGKALVVLEHLYQRPMVMVRDVREVTGLSAPSANSLVTKLEGAGILTETTGQARYRVFAYQPYLDILLDGEKGRRSAG